MDRLTEPFFISVLICWIFSVCVHEFAHALVAYWGGDRSVRSRGYLSFNPLRYIDPITSILLPCVFLVMGGVPLPGGAVRIDRSSLKSRAWESLVAAAGPASNLLLFGLIAVVIHPATGFVDPNLPADAQPNGVKLLGVMAVLQLFAVLFNLLPVPPLDGFGIIEPFLNAKTRQKLLNPQVRWMGLLLLFFVVFRIPAAREGFMNAISWVLDQAGLPFSVTWRFYNIALFGSSD